MSNFSRTYFVPRAPDPLSILGSKLASWLRADDNLTGAASWPNRIPGQSAFARSGAAPTLASLGSSPALRFDGTNSYAAAALASPIPIGNYGIINVFTTAVSPTAFMQVAGVGDGADLTVANNSIYVDIFSAARDLYTQLRLPASGGFTVFAKQAPLNTAMAAGCQNDFTNFQIANGQFVACGAPTPPAAPSTAPLTVAYVATGGNAGQPKLNGLFAEQLIMRDLITPSELAALSNYFTRRYGVGPV